MTPMVPLSELAEERAITCALAEEVQRLKATNRRLNRRCQLAEAAARKTVDDCRRANVTPGLAVLRFIHTDLKRELRELLARA